MKYYVKKSFRMDLFKIKLGLDDYEIEGVKYWAIGVLDVCLINKETREITQMGIGNVTATTMIEIIKKLGGLETVE